ncbi:MAG TPA: xanthine dehydrogenase accessory protein XdhC [Dermatophilaceae bacterium]|nr:xanthine dehydrogenase accessory protein XdhC [Dermatophilaceae bacterium]
MNWVDAVQQLRERREPGVLVTLTSVRGHAPRQPGAKLVVTADAQWGSIGGGNLEAVAVRRARELLAEGASSGGGTVETLSQELNEHADAPFGRQCCGGVTSVLLEVLPVIGSVAIVGMGHVGRELARILARHDLELHLIDGRPEFASAAALPAIDDALARVHWHLAPWPEPVLAELPAGTHLVVMTHDHGEDAAVCDAALRRESFASIGLIGSSAKWRRIEKALREWGHDPATTARITTPIGDPTVPGKEPAAIALAVATDLVRRLAAQASDRDATELHRP